MSTGASSGEPGSAPGGDGAAPAADRLRLAPERLRRRLDPSSLAFETTAEVEPLAALIGQPRVLESIEFGVEMSAPGYNLFLAGAPGSGRTETIRDYLAGAATARLPADDWVYVHDFGQPHRPRAIRLPAGRAGQLAADVDALVVAARRHIGAAFEGDNYGERRRQALAQISQQRDAVLAEMRRFATEHSFGLEPTPTGLVAVPMLGDRPLTPDEIRLLTPDRQADLERSGAQVQEAVVAGLRRLHQLDRSAAELIRRVDREIAAFAIDPLLHALRERYETLPDVLVHLDQVRDSIIDSLADFRPRGAETDGAAVAPWEVAAAEERLGRYHVNVLVRNGETSPAPVVFEPNPTYTNLVGRIEYRGVFGTLVTDFRQVRAGALHRANGGFLVLEAADVLRNPAAWDALKRALRAREIRIESLAEQFSAAPTTTLAPEPIPLAVKVVLIGPTDLFHLLHAVDEDFGALFKVKVDFAPDMEWSDDHVRSYAAFISRRVRESGLQHFDRTGVARVVEHGSRLRDDQRKLSTRLQDIGDLVTEASFWAGKAGRQVVSAEDVNQAVARREARSSLPEERMREMIDDGTIRIDIDGERVGQVNGLTVVELGDYRFGLPARVTARVSMGRGTIESIERETELSGPIHSKGFLILSGYLAGQYGQEWPLALRGTLTFEQSYGGIEGDSASATELYALLSALSGLPLKQSVAVTGSVDQLGEVQAVGGVTHKIEGFFHACQARGLTGRQGVAIPAANVANLMLSDEVVQAVEQGRFHIWALRSVDEGMELLTGRAPGDRQEDGSYPDGTVHRLVQERLRGYTQRLNALSGQADGRTGLGPAPAPAAGTGTD